MTASGLEEAKQKIDRDRIRAMTTDLWTDPNNGVADAPVLHAKSVVTEYLEGRRAVDELARRARARSLSALRKGGRSAARRRTASASAAAAAARQVSPLRFSQRDKRGLWSRISEHLAAMEHNSRAGWRQRVWRELAECSRGPHERARLFVTDGGGPVARSSKVCSARLVEEADRNAQIYATQILPVMRKIVDDEMAAMRKEALGADFAAVDGKQQRDKKLEEDETEARRLLADARKRKREEEKNRDSGTAAATSKKAKKAKEQADKARAEVEEGARKTIRRAEQRREDQKAGKEARERAEERLERVREKQWRRFQTRLQKKIEKHSSENGAADDAEKPKRPARRRFRIDAIPSLGEAGSSFETGYFDKMFIRAKIRGKIEKEEGFGRDAKRRDVVRHKGACECGRRVDVEFVRS